MIFFVTEVVYLGHKIDAEGLHPLSEKVEACNENFGPGQKLVWPDHFRSAKICPAGPILVSEIGPPWSKLV